MQILRTRVEKELKKVLIIKGSARENGCTNTILNNTVKELNGVQIEVFDTFNERFNPCNDCRNCLEASKCIYSDLDNFFEDFENADVIVFASPVFNGGFSAPLKALIDRFQIYFNLFYKNGKKQPIKKRRTAIFLCASGRNAKEEFSFMRAQLERSFTILNMKLCGAVLCENTDKSDDYTKAQTEFSTLLKRSLNNE